MLRTARPRGASVAASWRSSTTRALSPRASCSSAMRASRSASTAAFASRRFCARDGCGPLCWRTGNPLTNHLAPSWAGFGFANHDGSWMTSCPVGDILQLQSSSRYAFADNLHLNTSPPNGRLYLLLDGCRSFATSLCSSTRFTCEAALAHISGVRVAFHVRVSLALTGLS